jgi:hypothetical protein
MSENIQTETHISDREVESDYVDETNEKNEGEGVV